MEEGTDGPLPCLITDRAYDGDAFRAGLAQRGFKAVLPARGRRTNPSLTTPGTVPDAQRRGTRPWLAQGVRRVAPRYEMINTPIVSWEFCTWRGLGSG